MLKCIEGGALLGVGVAVPEDVDGMLGTELALGRWPARQGEPGIDSTDISEGVAVRFWGVAERSKSPCWEQIRIVLQYAEKMWTKEESLEATFKVAYSTFTSTAKISRTVFLFLLCQAKKQTCNKYEFWNLERNVLTKS